MATYQYRAMTAAGAIREGQLDASSRGDVLERVRQLGLRPIEAVEVQGKATPNKVTKTNAQTRKAVSRAVAELAVLLGAGLTLDRALTIAIDNIAHRPTQNTFATVHAQVKEGVPLSRAMLATPALFSPMAAAMTEAGEANGELDKALAKLADSLERAEALRATLQSAMIYPIILCVIAVSVILVMLLVVVPQFENLLSISHGHLPPLTLAIMGASHALKTYGLFMLLGLVGLFFLGRQWLRQPSVTAVVDRLLLQVPQIGPLLAQGETARFARVLGSLVGGGVPVPTAMGIAQRSLVNTHMRSAIARVTEGLNEGGGLTGPLAAAGIFPKIAIGFFRTGEETAELGMMLDRLADVLDRDVRLSIERLVALLTPLITVVLGGIVATVIASIMSAIIGFNDLALAP